MSSFVQVAGSILILVPFVLVQRGRLRATAHGYVVANTVGSGVLAVDALVGRQWGFLLLEGTWAVVSAMSLVSVLIGSRAGRRSVSETGAAGRGGRR